MRALCCWALLAQHTPFLWPLQAPSHCAPQGSDNEKDSEEGEGQPSKRTHPAPSKPSDFVAQWVRTLSSLVGWHSRFVRSKRLAQGLQGLWDVIEVPPSSRAPPSPALPLLSPVS